MSYASFLAAVAALAPSIEYRFDEGSGALIDHGSVGADAPVVAGSPGYGGSGPDVGWPAIDFDGASAFATSNADALAFGTPTSVTVHAVVNVTGMGPSCASGPVGYVMSLSSEEDTGPTGNGIFLQAGPTDAGEWASFGSLGAQPQTPGWDLLFGEWATVGFSYEATSGLLTTFQNGCATGERAVGGIAWNAARIFKIAGQVKPGCQADRYLYGAEAHLAVWDEALDRATMRGLAVEAGLDAPCPGWRVGRIGL